MDSADNDAVRQDLVVQGVLLSGNRSSFQSLSASVPTLLGQKRPAPPSQSSSASTALPSAPPFSAEPCEPYIPVPEWYSGSFLLRCSLVCDLQPLTYPSDRAKIAFVVKLLSGRVVWWATAVTENQTPASAQFYLFKEELRRVFDHPDRVEKVAVKLHSLRQGSTLVADYSIQFCILGGGVGCRKGSACIVGTQAISSVGAWSGQGD